MSIETIARRYAIALADVVLKNGETETVVSELKDWGSMIASSGELRSAFGNPAIQQANKVRVLESLIERTRPSRTTANFLRVLLRNNRITELDEINQRFEAELAERSGVISAGVTSARELSEAEKRELEAGIARMTGKQVRLAFEIDRELIGGVVTRIGSTVYDGSVRTQLKNLKEQMIEA